MSEVRSEGNVLSVPAHTHPDVMHQQACPMCNQGKTVPELNCAGDVEEVKPWCPNCDDRDPCCMACAGHGYKKSQTAKGRCSCGNQTVHGASVCVDCPSPESPCDHRWRRTEDGLDLYCVKCGICCPEDDYTRADAEGLCAIAGIDTQNRERKPRGSDL